MRIDRGCGQREAGAADRGLKASASGHQSGTRRMPGPASAHTECRSWQEQTTNQERQPR
jgi:hypothetical protein